MFRFFIHFFSFTQNWSNYLFVQKRAFDQCDFFLIYEQLKFFLKNQIKTQIKSNHIKKYCVCNIQPSNFVTIKFIKWHAKDINWNKTEIFKNIILIFWGQILSNIRRRCGQRKCGRHTKIWRRGIWGYGNEYALCQQENQICLGC